MNQDRQWRNANLKRAHFFEKVARYFITTGGGLVIVAVLGILFVVLKTAVPLFHEGDFSFWEDNKSPGEPVTIGIDDYLQYVYSFDGKGGLSFQKLSPAGELGKPEFHSFGEGTFLVRESGKHLYSLTDEAGTTQLIKVKFRSKFNDGGQRIVSPDVQVVTTFEPPPFETQNCRLTQSSEAVMRLCVKGQRVYAQKVPTGDGDDDDFGGDDEEEPSVWDLSLTGAHEAFLLTGDGDRAFFGGSESYLVEVSFEDDAEVSVRRFKRPHPDAKIQAMAFLIGESTVVTGDDQGRIQAWFETSGADGGKVMTPIRVVGQLPKGIKTLRGSYRDKSLVASDESGVIKGYFLTSDKETFSTIIEDEIRAIGSAPRNNALAVATASGHMNFYKMDIPHPESNLKTLLSKVWYENYSQPDYVWQSTGGSDDFESKLSLVPLIFGTLKSTFYAMIFALPISILGAIYTSQFASSRFRSLIKPGVELMASIPSVVIGFLAALWLAPMMEEWIVSLGVFLICLPLYFLLFNTLWCYLREWGLARKIERGREFIITIFVIVLCMATSYLVAPGIEENLFEGSFALWTYEVLGIRYDQRNSIIISLALGFAVIPIIFSIADDSLTAVPGGLKAASLALGASRWQTVYRVILPSASPGIFVAAMIGLGRAVGETMIVLMATGNTPIMSWDAFSGMRTLSANIAVEVPEAPVDGTLYRTLFLCAVVLFCMTFTLNTLGETIRHNLRKKYGRF